MPSAPINLDRIILNTKPKSLVIIPASVSMKVPFINDFADIILIMIHVYLLHFILSQHIILIKKNIAMGIYLDNAATTYMYPEVIDAMWPYYSREFYNPQAGYTDSKRVKEKIEECREILAGIINAKTSEIYFTSGGTESNNWICSDAGRRKAHVITSSIEHKSMINPLLEYKRRGGRVTFIEPDKEGLVSAASVRRAINGYTGLISIMMANNEIGTIEPVEEIGHIAREYGILYHTDAVQAFGHIPIDVERLNLDSLSVSSHKFHGPKGTGFIYIRENNGVKPMIFGGGQERNMRAGTENVPGIVGMTVAAELAHRNMEKYRQHITAIRDYMFRRLQQLIPEIKINGSTKKRLPNNINFCVKDIDAVSLLVMLDMEGIYASSGSACNGIGNEISHVLKAIKLPEEYAAGALRITLDESMTMRTAEYVVQVISKNIKKLKNI